MKEYVNIFGQGACKRIDPGDNWSSRWIVSIFVDLGEMVVGSGLGFFFGFFLLESFSLICNNVVVEGCIYQIHVLFLIGCRGVGCEGGILFFIG